ncbi:MAG: T9SS type A sorting domain-containing protein, partial [bacterium]
GIRCYSPGGQLLWDRDFDATASDVEPDSENNVIVTGHFWGSTDFGGGTRTAVGSRDIFVAKYGSDGTWLWDKTFGSSGQNAGRKVATNGTDIYVAGHFENTIDFGCGLHASAGAYDIFLIKLDRDGGCVWSNRWGGNGYDEGWGLTAMEGSVVLVGYFSGTVDFGAGGRTSVGDYDILVLKTDQNGNYQWDRTWGSPGQDGGYDVATMPGSRVVVAGAVAGPVDFGGGVRPSGSEKDMYALILGLDGDYVCDHVWATPNDNIPRGVSVDERGGIALSGEFRSAVNFDCGEKVSVGERDAFLLGLSGSPEVVLDIKPGSCPNPLSLGPFDRPPADAKSKKGGVLPIALLGTASVDVNDIDTSTLLLEGVAPLRYSYEDVSTVVASGGECRCTDGGPDGYLDLTLKFDKSDVITALGAMAPGDIVPLVLTGQLWDGTSFKAVDCVTIVGGQVDPVGSDSGNEVVLRGAAPNPFNPVTRISYFLPREELVRLLIYDIRGRLVQRLVVAVQTGGEHVVEWNARGVASGVYFCAIEVGSFTQTRKLILLR